MAHRRVPWQALSWREGLIMLPHCPHSGHLALTVIFLGRQQHSFGVMKGPSCLELEEGPPSSLEPVTSFFQSRDPPPPPTSS